MASETPMASVLAGARAIDPAGRRQDGVRDRTAGGGIVAVCYWIAIASPNDGGTRMRFLILDRYYPESLRRAYADNPGLDQLGYAEQLGRLLGLGIDRADFLMSNLRALGHEAEQVLVNAFPLQGRWARDHGLPAAPEEARHSRFRPGRLARRIHRGLRRRLGLPTGPADWASRVVEAQVEAYQPDVVFDCDVLQFDPGFLRHLKRNRRRFLVGECGYPTPRELDLTPYDLVVSCNPGFVERFRREGMRAELLLHAFEPSLLERLGAPPALEGVAAFIGSVGALHTRRMELLDFLSRHVPLECWSSGGGSFAPDSPLRRRTHPPVWGYDMYRRLQRSKIALNIHVDATGRHAGNLRLFEATGVGSLLVTDMKDNLNDIFAVGREVVAYRSAEECAGLIRYYLEHEEERQAIARAGQQRTLREHTYRHRMEQLARMVAAAIG
jgi:spore maturation protein CgeB